ncbi:MAG: hypothetical protein V1738_00725 [Patescibacteria group bacterium]
MSEVNFEHPNLSEQVDTAAEASEQPVLEAESTPESAEAATNELHETARQQSEQSKSAVANFFGESKTAVKQLWERFKKTPTPEEQSKLSELDQAAETAHEDYKRDVAAEFDEDKWLWGEEIKQNEPENTEPATVLIEDTETREAMEDLAGGFEPIDDENIESTQLIDMPTNIERNLNESTENISIGEQSLVEQRKKMATAEKAVADLLDDPQVETVDLAKKFNLTTLDELADDLASYGELAKLNQELLSAFDTKRDLLEIKRAVLEQAKKADSDGADNSELDRVADEISELSNARERKSAEMAELAALANNLRQAKEIRQTEAEKIDPAELDLTMQELGLTDGSDIEAEIAATEAQLGNRAEKNSDVSSQPADTISAKRLDLNQLLANEQASLTATENYLSGDTDRTKLTAELQETLNDLGTVGLKREAEMTRREIERLQTELDRLLADAETPRDEELDQLETDLEREITLVEAGTNYLNKKINRADLPPDLQEALADFGEVGLKREVEMARREIERLQLNHATRQEQLRVTDQSNESAELEARLAALKDYQKKKALRDELDDYLDETELEQRTTDVLLDNLDDLLEDAPTLDVETGELTELTEKPPTAEEKKIVAAAVKDIKKYPSLTKRSDGMDGHYASSSGGGSGGSNKKPSALKEYFGELWKQTKGLAGDFKNLFK